MMLLLQVPARRRHRSQGRLNIASVVVLVLIIDCTFNRYQKKEVSPNAQP
jgi:hypothetical protein